MEKSKTDKAFLERLKTEAPEVFGASVDFDVGIVRVMKAVVPQKRRSKQKAITKAEAKSPLM